MGRRSAAPAAWIGLVLLASVSCEPATEIRRASGGSADPDEPVVSAGVQPGALEAGATYRLTEPTPILPDPDPGDPTMAMVGTVTLAAPVSIHILRRVETAGVLWYELRVTDRDMRGWVSLPGLGDQTILSDP